MKKIAQMLAFVIVTLWIFTGCDSKNNKEEQEMNTQKEETLTPAQQAMVATWEEHMRAEFELLNVDSTLATMVEEPYLVNIPILVGGDDQKGVRDFYTNHMIGQFPADMEIVAVSRTVGNDQLVEELVLKFTHTTNMDWMLPGVAPTGKKVEVPVVVIVGFKDDKMESERIYWDQSSVLVQLGLIEAEKLPVTGVESAQKLLQLVGIGDD
ncbi:ester cyclase [Desulfobacterota bacterium AH_259_B03_O07]|nr:ester cyclase [Desulfobacterota bacterium AH_259_B03_O07]